MVDGPKRYYISHPMYFTRGYLFHTRGYGQRRQTMNYGVCVRGQNFSDDSDESDFHGNVEEIVELNYGGMLRLKITLFKCEWYDPTLNRGTRHWDGGRVVDVKASGRYPKYDPYILASQADQVCYIPYPSTRASSRGVWLNVVKVNPRANIIGNYKEKDLVLLQQETDSDVIPVGEINVPPLCNDPNARELDLDIGFEDMEAEDEFQINLSSSGDDDDEDSDVDPEEAEHIYDDM